MPRTPRHPAPVDECSAGLLSVVSPVYGCDSCLEELVERVKSAMRDSGMDLEIILVDDGSPDDAWARITELAAAHPEVRGLRLSRNFGQHYAISAGIEHARGELVAVMDCDLQDPPEDLPRLVAAARAGHDIVLAQRTARQDSWFKRLTSYLFYRLLAYLTGIEQDHSTANFGVFSRKVIGIVNHMPEADRCFPLMVKWTGFSPFLVPIQHARRTKGESSYSVGKLVRLAVSIVLSYSDKPLRLVVKLGLAFSSLAFLIVLLSIYRYLSGDIAVAGFTSVLASIWLLGGIIIFCLGVTGLYLGRLFNDAKQRPYYVVSTYLNFDGDL
jgi:polyisoprenyl-phosphate glycosyltransferase